MASASNNGGYYPYPKVVPVEIPNQPAPERAGGERTGEIDYSQNANPVKGLQPGFDLAGVPLASLTPELVARMAGPQP
jgi:hypothetical protein